MGNKQLKHKDTILKEIANHHEFTKNKGKSRKEVKFLNTAIMTENLNGNLKKKSEIIILNGKINLENSTPLADNDVENLNFLYFEDVFNQEFELPSFTSMKQNLIDNNKVNKEHIGKIDEIYNEIKKKCRKIISTIILDSNLVSLFITDFQIIEFDLKSLTIVRSIDIENLKYLTLSSGITYLILHQDNQENFIIKNNLVDQIAFCISSSFFMLTKETNYYLPIISVNSKFTIFDKLKTTSNFKDYSNYLNDFLEIQLIKIKVIKKGDWFKYTTLYIQTSEKESYKLVDFVVTQKKFLCLNYINQKLCFEFYLDISYDEVESIGNTENEKGFYIALTNQEYYTAVCPIGNNVKSLLKRKIAGFRKSKEEEIQRLSKTI